MDGRPDAATLWSVSRLLGEYCSTMDSGLFDAWAELFAEDGRVELGTASFEGRERLHRFAAQAPPGVHVSGLPVISLSGDVISSVCSWIFVPRGGGPLRAGYYHDTIVWTGGRHRFSVRRIQLQESVNDARKD